MVAVCLRRVLQRGSLARNVKEEMRMEESAKGKLFMHVFAYSVIVIEPDYINRCVCFVIT